ncbi:uncharacterized protein MYCFIDRAFT_77958 [Pseudocercospora fijiensis CIRAD86]|uniref:Uncharacterized protein n=1 Tax=Pseudocercospora fijiensis (strain CIRAD86) TaxID=383855 RepID=M3A6G4_PSEFD|nr:uncharacterized protein MYCFIDRAFT_77958 [Pseudocercospora fijiensis CIRAD86]EME80191.1 hypothetical protein MYCFIDRAFT_77958 [Pseudocercospora fijiensis CIRAD86]
MPFSEKQMEQLAKAWQCCKTEPKVDYKAFATVAGLSSVHSAEVTWGNLKKKLMQEYGAMGSKIKHGSDIVGESKASSKKRKASDSDLSTGNGSPQKRGRGKGKGKIVESRQSSSPTPELSCNDQFDSD